METRAYRGEIDYDRLAEHFRVLSLPARIRLLHKLQVPHAASDIELKPFRKARELSPDRALSRQAVEGHLEKLRDAGLVRARPGARDGQPVTEYVLNASRLFVLVDEMRRLSVLRPAPTTRDDWSRSIDRTEPAAARREPDPLPDEPALVLASGPLEGTALPLRGDGPWRLGRSGQVALTIPHDPYVSAENAEVWREGARWFVRDLADSSNGTTRNWRLLPKGEAAPLRAGDTLGVGRTLLVARAL